MIPILEKIMKTISNLKKFAVSVFTFACLMVGPLVADDNEVLLDQEGDNLTLTILQAGYGNTLSGNATQGADLTLTGSSLILDLIQDGNNNDMFGSWVLDGTGSSVLDFYFLGDSNVWAAQGQGESCGTNCTGTSTMAGILVNSDNAVWDMEITGDDNKFATNQSGNAGHSLKVVLNGSDGDFQFTQNMTTTCSGGVCHGIIDVDLDSENASVSIKQGD